MSHPAINGSLSPNAVLDITRHYGKRIGQKALAPHDLRRTYAKLAYAGGASIDEIRNSLGHSSIETTMRYVGAYGGHSAGSFIDVEGGK